MYSFWFLVLILITFLGKKYGPRLFEWRQRPPIFPVHTVSIYTRNLGMEAEFVIGGKTCARMGKDAFLKFENGESYLLHIEEETKVELIRTDHGKKAQLSAVRDPRSDGFKVTVGDSEFRILPRSRTRMFNAGYDILLKEKRVGMFWTTKSLVVQSAEFFIDLPEREMVLLTILASEAIGRGETRNGKNL